MHNSCSMPNTEMVSDRENSNLCDEFQIKESEQNTPKTDAKANFNNLFKD